MALNPQLFPNGMPVPFVNEMFVLARDGVEFEIDKIPGFVSHPALGQIICCLNCCCVFFLIEEELNNVPVIGMIVVLKNQITTRVELTLVFHELVMFRS